MGDILDLGDLMWSGKSERHQWRALNALEEVAPRTWFYSGFANMSAFETDEGLLVVDPGARNNAADKYAALREVSEAPLHTAVYTHGHQDHIWGVEHYRADAEARGAPRPRVIAHEGVLARFDRYRKTTGYNGIINLRQFRGGAGTPRWPTDYIEPDEFYRDALDLTIGSETFELRHGRGETDDATWVYAPERGVLCTGDLFVWVAPNAGNPQKVQRYCGEWAEALREMASRQPSLLLPGHGPPIAGADRVRAALEDTASYLESLEQQTLALMNEGATLDEILHRVEPPAELAEKPYLKAAYDEPEFIVRNIWRLFGGWYDGQPAHLKPAPEADQARAVVELAGGVEAVVTHAEAAAAGGDFRLACQLADWAHLAAPDDEQARVVRGAIYLERSQVEASTMAVGIYRTAAREMGVDLDSGATFDAQDRARAAD